MHFIEKLNKLDAKEKGKLVLLCVVFVIGLLLIFGSNLFLSERKEDEKKTAQVSVDGVSTDEYKSQLEENIKDTLSKVEGVGKIDVTVTLSKQIDKEVIYNESTSGSVNESGDVTSSKQESTSKDAVMVKEGNNQKPYTVSSEYPEVVGVVVVCEGAVDTNTQYYITKSVQALLDVSSYRIVVLPMKNDIKDNQE